MGTSASPGPSVKKAVIPSLANAMATAALPAVTWRWTLDGELQEAEPRSHSFLPPFANAANRQLDADTYKLQRELHEALQELADNDDRAAVMSDHLANVHIELKNSQTGLAAQSEAVSGEQHLQRLAARETVRLAT